MKTPNLVVGLVALVVGAIFLVLSVNPQPLWGPCLAPQNVCDIFAYQYHQYVVANFVDYFLLGSVSLTFSITVLFLGRAKEPATHEESTRVDPPLDSSAPIRP